MTDRERDELLINIFNDVKNVKNDVKELKSNVKEIEGNMNKMQDNINEMQDNINEMQDNINEMQGNMNKTQGNINKIENKLNEIEKEQRNLSRTVAKIEYEHGNKLQAILDVLCGQQQKNEEFEEKFNEHDKILSKHDDEIFYLKEKIG